MSNLSLFLLSAYATRAKNRLVYKTKNVFATQEQFLLDLLSHHQQTVLGRSLGLETIKTVEQFGDQIPVWSYEHYEPYISVQDKSLQKFGRKGFHENYHIQNMKPHEPDYSNPKNIAALLRVA